MTDIARNLAIFGLLGLFTAVSACGSHLGTAGGESVVDDDGDGISNIDEGESDGLDTDGDGTPDYQDSDSDNDGIDDETEAGDADPTTSPVDSDLDGIPDFRDSDSDNNGRDDGTDGIEDGDNDGIADFADWDDDGDGIPDTTELGDTPEAPLDSDGDETPDFRDTDSDNDTIADIVEQLIDADDDGIPSYLDTDSDDDCRPDAVEAGDDDLNTAPIDTDGDGKFNFIDFDSDNDGLLDELEDANCDGVVDGSESSPLLEDSDGDGASDLVEDAAGTDPTSDSDNPATYGDFVFVVPYEEPPSPTTDTLDFATDITQADVVFAMDTTGSMGGEINALKTSLGTLIGDIRTAIPNTAFGVTGYDDFPTHPYGSAAHNDEAFYLLHRVMTTSTPTGLSSVQAAVDSYTTHYGVDLPESGWEAAYQIATGAGTTEGGGTVPAFDAGTAHPASPPAGEEVGTIGGVGFRDGSLPIVIMITDASNHNSDVVSNSDYPFTAASSTDALTELNSLSARVIGVASQGGMGNVADDLIAGVSGTNTVVPPDSWGEVGTRPATCAIDQCCTGIDGAGEAVDGSGDCPLLFNVNSSGSGLGTAVSQAVEVLVGNVELDVGALTEDDPSDSVDAIAAFIDRLEANPAAALPCAPGQVAIDTDANTIDDTFTGVLPGTTVCFDVVPKMNTTVPALTTPQMFRATINVEGDGVTTLDTRDIWFLVPPELPVEQIE